MMPFLKKAFKFLLILAALLAICLAASMGWLWVRHNRPVSLPPPSGPYLVGRVKYEWTDPKRLIKVWAADDRFILDQVEQLNAADPTGRFRGKLDLQAVGVFGHSFGRAAAAQVCMLDTRCKAGVNLDGYPCSEWSAPTVSVYLERTQRPQRPWLAAGPARHDSQAIASQVPSGQSQVIIEGMRHFNFTDQAIFFSPVIKLMGGLGSIDGQLGLEITRNDVNNFFNRTLKPTYLMMTDLY